MQGFPVSFNIYADSQQEADELSRAIKAFIGEQAQQGRAVTATKLAVAISKYKNNYLVNAYFK